MVGLYGSFTDKEARLLKSSPVKQIGLAEISLLGHTHSPAFQGPGGKVYVTRPHPLVKGWYSRFTINSNNLSGMAEGKGVAVTESR